MKGLQLFFQNFFNNKGQFVFLSLLIGKICGFLGSWLIIRLLPVSDFGILTIVTAVFALFISANGLGSTQSLLRYGSVTENLEEKKLLSNYLFYSGFKYQIFVTILFFASSLFFLEKFQDISLVFLFFSLRLVGFYFFSHIQSHLRINGENGPFSAVNNSVNISGVLLLLLFTYYYGFTGYLISIAITPFISLFWINRISLKKLNFTLSFTRKELFNYGIFASGTALLSDLLFSADILLLGFLLNEDAVANYKVAILIPANITFLSIVFMQTDFPTLAKNFQNKAYLRHYIFNYYKIFLPVCILVFALGLLFSKEIVTSFFGIKYEGNSLLFTVLLLGFAVNMLLRNLYGNLLSAVGKIKINSYISLLSLIVLVISAIILVPRWQGLGMAISISFTMIFTGAIFGLMFFAYFRKLK